MVCLGFENTWVVSKKWNVISRLYGSVYKILRLLLTAVEYSIVVVDTSSIPGRSQFLIPVLRNLCSEAVGT